ncbi:hypothetical protein, partial [Gordonia cholesterolivorans]|uniref:hypothetical protein n=1 Tax=Gordonia cholesterolivorans TaxID=559625 RepID=UPI0031F7D117
LHQKGAPCPACDCRFATTIIAAQSTFLHENGRSGEFSDESPRVGVLIEELRDRRQRQIDQRVVMIDLQADMAAG